MFHYRHTLSCLLVLTVLLGGVFLRVSPPATAQAVSGQPLAAPCDQLTAVPIAECSALVELYTLTAGVGWINATGWLTAGANGPCDWYGVSCAGGHVRELALAGNRLTGPVPRVFANLPFLTRLSLAGNRLQGIVPPTVCLFNPTLISLALAYNALDTRRDTTRTCLDRLDPDWATTQTIPPRNLRPSAITGTGIEVMWTPASFAVDGSFNEISYATSVDGTFITHGRTADTRATSYRIDGLTPGVSYLVRLQTVTPAHSGNPDEVRSGYAYMVAVTRASGVLLMVYFPADNDLSPYVATVRERLRLGSIFNPNVQVVLLTDQAGTNDTALVTIAGGQVQTTNAIEARWGQRELNTADPDVLAWFLQYARTTYPAEREIVSLMGHGLPLMPAIAWPETSTELAVQAGAARTMPPLPKEYVATPDDITDRGSMSTIGLGQALASATDNGAKPFDILFFDQCFQGNLDTLYEVRSAAEVFIASPNYAWLAAPYDEYLPLLAPVASNQAIADALMARYERNLNDQHPNVIFSLSRSDIDALALAVSTLGGTLERALQGGHSVAISSAVRDSQFVDTTQCGPQLFDLGPPDELIGIGAFAFNLHRNFPLNDPFGVHAATEQVMTALSGIRKVVRTGTPYIAPDQIWNYDNTVTLLAPLPPNAPAAVAWRSSIYTETMPLQAMWTPVPTTTVTITSSFAYVRDGTWDQFLAAWYGADRRPTVGQWCNYRPPVLVASEDAETLELTADTSDPAALRLRWTPTSDTDVVAYLVYAKGPYDSAWLIYQVVGPRQTTTELRTLEPGASYTLKLVAQDATGVALAQSNEVVMGTATHMVFLPLIMQ